MAPPLPPPVPLLHYLGLHRLRSGMSEKCINIVLRCVLNSLRSIQTDHPAGHIPEVSPRRILVSFNNPPSIRISYNPHVQGADAPNALPHFGIRGVGILAVELAYGSFPQIISINNNMEIMAGNLARILNQKLQDPGKKIKRLPSDIQLLLNTQWVDQYVADKQKRRNSNLYGRFMMTVEKLREERPPGADRALYVRKRSFSRKFLQVVRLCLREFPPPIADILAQDFFRNTKYISYFEMKMREAAAKQTPATSE